MSSLNDFFFGWSDPKPAEALRIGIGIFSALNLILLALDHTAWFTELGPSPLVASETWTQTRYINLFRGVTDPAVSLGILISGIVAAIAATIGVLPRTFFLITLIVTMSAQMRAPFHLHVADTLLRLLLIFMCFLRTGQHWTLPHRKTHPRPIPIWPMRLIACQLSLMYFATVLEKLFAPAWRNGTAVYFTQRLEGYQRLLPPGFLAQPPFTTFLTYFTLIAESVLIFAPFSSRIRRWAVPLGIGLHGGIILTMNVPLISELTLVAYASYYAGMNGASLTQDFRLALTDLRQVLSQKT